MNEEQLEIWRASGSPPAVRVVLGRSGAPNNPRESGPLLRAPEQYPAFCAPPYRPRVNWWRVALAWTP